MSRTTTFIKSSSTSPGGTMSSSPNFLQLHHRSFAAHPHPVHRSPWSILLSLLSLMVRMIVMTKVVIIVPPCVLSYRSSGRMSRRTLAEHTHYNPKQQHHHRKEAPPLYEKRQKMEVWQSGFFSLNLNERCINRRRWGITSVRRGKRRDWRKV